MNPNASTTAWALHDLALATSLGGALFGRFALHSAVAGVSNPHERGAVIDTAWRRFSMVNLASHGVFAATWLVGRHILTGREIDRRTRALVTAKDVLMMTAVASGITSIAVGSTAIKDPMTGDPLPVDRDGCISADAPKRARVAEKVSSTFGVINLLALAGVVGVTAVLAMKAGTSGRFSLFSRFLP